MTRATFLQQYVSDTVGIKIHSDTQSSNNETIVRFSNINGSIKLL